MNRFGVLVLVLEIPKFVAIIQNAQAKQNLQGPGLEIKIGSHSLGSQQLSKRKYVSEDVRESPVEWGAPVEGTFACEVEATI